MENKEQDVVEVHVTGVSMAGKSELTNDSNGSAEKDQESSERTEGNNSE